ncbi:MAG: DUF4396 domain-containing protein [Myxococcota bacterium]
MNALLHTNAFWTDLPTHKRAAKATLTCLAGCSLGDFGTVIAFQILRPQTSFAVIMPLAMFMGIVTSMALETCLLKMKEGFSWAQSIRTAWSMSLLSMLAMEFAENTTDYLLTKGQVSPGEIFYWVALVLSLAAGFLVPFPYNYYKLKKYGKSCHG